MDPTILPSASMPSISSQTSLGWGSTLSANSSDYLLAYLLGDSTQSTSSHMADEERGTRAGRHGISPRAAKRTSDNRLWRSTPNKSDRVPLRPLRETELPADVGPAPTTATAFPAPSKHRPPPLQLRPFRPESNSSFRLADDEQTPVPSSIRSGSPLDLPPPWTLLDDLPSPPPHIPRSKTSANVSRIFRRGGNTVEVTTTPSKPRSYSRECREENENVPLTPKRVLRKRNRTKSFGSLGKGFQPLGPVSVPSTPTPSPRPARRSRANSANNHEPIGSRAFTYSHRRDTFASRLFALASPKPDLDVTLIHTTTHCTQHYEARIANSSVGTPGTLDTNPLSSVGRLESSKAMVKERETQDTGGSISPPTTPLSLSKPLAIPPRRTRSPSYIDLHVPPWRQTTVSPTRTSFVAVGTLISAPNTPASAAFDLLNEMTYLPSSESMNSLRLGVDPFGAGEPTSFFRFEFGRNEGGSVDVVQNMMEFYEGIELAMQGKRGGKRSIQRKVTSGTVPEIVVVSSSVMLLR
ncbi:hypothetical protein FS749_008144 [Ceratobasidium sp. UAMH 11750]|nr:hypothetical protein FS749_008144 [Ceratobasidium sp. UAMH 11750]